MQKSNCDERCHSEVKVNQKDCYNDKYSIEIKCNAKYKIIGFESKACILSYDITKDTSGSILFLYGIIITKVNYCLENDYKKYYEVFITTFNKSIYFSDCNVKISCVSVNIENKYYKKMDKACILGYYILDFHITMLIPNNIESNKCGSSILCNTEFCNTISINNNNWDNKKKPCKDNHPDRPYGNIMDEFNAPPSYLKPEVELKNDWIRSLTSYQYNNRL